MDVIIIYCDGFSATDLHWLSEINKLYTQKWTHKDLTIKDYNNKGTI